MVLTLCSPKCHFLNPVYTLRYGDIWILQHIIDIIDNIDQHKSIMEMVTKSNAVEALAPASVKSAPITLPGET